MMDAWIILEFNTLDLMILNVTTLGVTISGMMALNKPL
jgi:hypothetical protein